jgi:hypothetical protein
VVADIITRVLAVIGEIMTEAAAKHHPISIAASPVATP